MYNDKYLQAYLAQILYAVRNVKQLGYEGSREAYKLCTRVQVTDGAPQLDALHCTLSLTFLAHESVLQ
jgi:hypothetical protein